MTIETLSARDHSPEKTLEISPASKLAYATAKIVAGIHMTPVPKGIYSYNQADNSDIIGHRTRHLGTADFAYPKVK